MFKNGHLTFKTSLDASAILTKLYNILEEQDYVTLANCYDICGLTHDHDTSMKYGWNNLRGGAIVATKDGYEVRLPDPVRLDRRDNMNTEEDIVTLRMPNADTVNGMFTMIPKEVLQKSYIDSIGTQIQVNGDLKTVISVEITREDIIVKLQ